MMIMVTPRESHDYAYAGIITIKYTGISTA